MKNIHILPTDKPSRLHYFTANKAGYYLYPNNELVIPNNPNCKNQNIYITSDEEIKEGDWCFYVNSIYKVLRINSNNRPIIKMSDGTFEISYYRKIILTTDQDLIADGVQAIGDEFLEWFVKNPSCEEVMLWRFHGINTSIAEVNAISGDGSLNWQGKDDLRDYKIIIPSEEVKQELEKEMFELEQELDIPSHLRWHNSKPKQETLEEVRVVKRTELYNSILSIVKQIPRKAVEGDAMDAPSCAYELEQLFLKWQQETPIDKGEGEAYRQELFNYLHDNFVVIASESEMQEIERIVLSTQQERMYSEMDIVLILSKFRDMKMIAFSEWFEKFRKK